MPVGSVIQDTDYNNIRNKVINVLGTGSGNSGYGQTVQSSAVAEGQQVTANQWAGLRFDLYNCLVHQTGSTPSIVSVSQGNTIQYGTSHPNNSYDTLANTATSNRFNIGSGRYDTISLGNRSSGDISWESEAILDITYSWSTSEAARHFFNSGGKIRVSSSLSASASSSQITTWVNLLSSAGTQSFGGSTSGNTSVNWFGLTTSFQTWYSIQPSSSYSMNIYRLQAKCNASNNSSGTATQLIIRVWLRDDYDDPAGQETSYPPQDRVSGTLTSTSDYLKPTGPLQPAPGAGTFTVSGPATTTFSSWSTADGGSAPIPPSPPVSYNEYIVYPSTINTDTGGSFTAYAYGGVPYTNYELTYTDSKGRVILSGINTLDGAGNASGTGAWITPGTYGVAVYFYATGNTRTTTITATTSRSVYNYSPNWTNEFASSYGHTASQFLDKGLDIGDSHYDANFFLGVISGISRYGLFRRPDAAGLAFWTDYCIRNGYTSGSSGFQTAFFAALSSGEDSRSRTSNKSWDGGPGNGAFYDRP